MSPRPVLSGDIAKMIIPSNMLSGVAGADGRQAEIIIGEGDRAALPEDVSDRIGERPLIQLILKIDGHQTDWSNPSAPVTVSIPYTPTAEELLRPESIVVWYIDGAGNVVTVPNGHYDPATETVTFSTTHFSDYAVACNPVAFADVAEDAWYYDAVSFIAAREITTGTGDGSTFSPDAFLTRGEFIVLMMNAYGIAPDTNPTDNFADAGSTYYTDCLAAAKRLGITDGVGGNRYTPSSPITRQETFTLLYNALKAIGKLPESGTPRTASPTETGEDVGTAIDGFKDAGGIASWARDGMALFVETGIVSGDGERLNPASTATRAQFAQVICNLLSKPEY